MVAILKEFARRSGIGYQVLMKKWLDERIVREHDRLPIVWHGPGDHEGLRTWMSFARPLYPFTTLL
jgi:hypothetical protein